MKPSDISLRARAGQAWPIADVIIDSFSQYQSSKQSSVYADNLLLLETHPFPDSFRRRYDI